jgi:hypothetical protein
MKNRLGTERLDSRFPEAFLIQQKPSWGGSEMRWARPRGMPQIRHLDEEADVQVKIGGGRKREKPVSRDKETTDSVVGHAVDVLGDLRLLTMG